jgi:hypothetical protein
LIYKTCLLLTIHALIYKTCLLLTIHALIYKTCLLLTIHLEWQGGLTRRITSGQRYVFVEQITIMRTTVQGRMPRSPLFSSCIFMHFQPKTAGWFGIRGRCFTDNSLRWSASTPFIPIVAGAKGLSRRYLCNPKRTGVNPRRLRNTPVFDRPQVHLDRGRSAAPQNARDLRVRAGASI